MIRVETLEQTRRGLEPFIRLPFALYRGDANWTPPYIPMQRASLLGENNPLMRDDHAFFIAYDDERPVARVLAGVDRRLNVRVGESRGYVSLFECADDMDYAFAVLDAAFDFLRTLGVQRVVGPCSASVNDFSKGLLVEGFDTPAMLFNPYNPPYYDDFFQRYGFVKHRDHYAFHVDMRDFPVEGFEALTRRAMERFGFRVENVHVRRDNMARVAGDIVRVIDAAFPDSWEINPPTQADILDEMRQLLRFSRPELVVMAYAGERPVGLLVALPDFNRLLRKMRGRLFPFGFVPLLLERNRLPAARCIMLFVIPEYQKKAVNVALIGQAYRKAAAIGIREVEASTIDETNIESLLTVERVGAERSHVYREYEKVVD